ncbi:MAG: FAD-binding protein, partial [Oscillospiraceae bacterium]|nr:FAD-binding protein [Oscillospiraceae bacterium]
YVFLDITSKSEEFLGQRFPTIFKECLKRGINIAHDKIPVRPVQHYLMGGIKTDLDGRTGIAGLYACGESAATGVHGANRLASNSLLECLVFGRRTALSVNSGGGRLVFSCQSSVVSGRGNAGDELPVVSDQLPADGGGERGELSVVSCQLSVGEGCEGSVASFDVPVKPYLCLDFAALRGEIQQLMDDHCGVIRTGDGLQQAFGRVSAICDQLESVFAGSNEYLETLSIATVAKAILEAALLRTESVGSHYRV